MTAEREHTVGQMPLRTVSTLVRRGMYKVSKTQFGVYNVPVVRRLIRL